MNSLGYIAYKDMGNATYKVVLDKWHDIAEHGRRRQETSWNVSLE
jgi:hypothetical protein